MMVHNCVASLRLIFVANAISVIVLTSCGCGGDQPFDVAEPDSLVVYSIDGNEQARDLGRTAVEMFRGYPVLGKIEITDPSERKEIIAELSRARDRSGNSPAKGFWPRHAIRVTRADRIIDYVICFECYKLERLEKEARVVVPITRAPRDNLSSILQKNNIPEAPNRLHDPPSEKDR